MLFSVKVYVTVNCAISHRDVYVGLLSVYLDETFESSDAWPVQHQTYGYLPVREHYCLVTGTSLY